MYKILIATGEEEIERVVQQCIKQISSNDIQIEIAKNGRNAIECAERLCPELLVIDMQISGINGIEVLRAVKAVYPNVKVMIIGEAGNCDYIKELIENGVMEYLNKPLDHRELKGAINKIFIKVEEEKRRRCEELAMKEKIEFLAPMLEQGLISYFMFGKEEWEDIERFCVLLGIEEKNGYIMLLQIEKILTDMHAKDQSNICNFLRKMRKPFRDVVEKYISHSVCCEVGNYFVIFVPQEQRKQGCNKEFWEAIMKNATKIVQELKRIYKVKCKVGISEIHHITEMFQASEEAVRALESVQDDTVVHVSNVNTDDEQEADYPVLLERDLFVCIQNGDLKNVVYCLEKYSKWINTVYIHRSMDVKMKVLELVFRAEAIERENKECITYVGQGKCLSQIMKINNSEQLFLWLEERILKVCKSLYKNEKRNHDVVKMAREFIEMNYAKDIDLEEISSYLQISPYYFSKLFKKKTGKNFIEYLTQIRLEHAKLLLTNSCKSMKEICMEVGYGDANYFSRLFKKNVGISPTEYKMEKCGV